MEREHAAGELVGPARDTDHGAPAVDRASKSGEALIVHLPRWAISGLRSEAVVGVIVAVYLIIFLLGLVRFPYFGPWATVDEQLMYFQVARSFNDHGFIQSAFLQDFSNSSNAAHHPFVYNHMPPGPEILTALVTRAFGERYRVVRLTFAVIFVIGIVYYVRFVAVLLARLGLGGAGLALLLIPPIVMLHSIDHPAYSVFPFFAFFPVVALDTYYRTGGRRWYWLALLVVLVGSLYLVYQQLLMLFASWVLLGGLRIIRLDRSDVLALLGAGCLGVVLHLLQSVALLGPRLSLEELRLTISNRMLGVPTTRELRDFYQSIAVVHQGFHKLDWRLFGDVMRESLRPVAGWGTSLLWAGLTIGGLVLALVASIRLISDRRLRIPRGEVTTAMHVLPASVLWAAGVIVFPLMVFPAYAASYQLSGANRFFVAAVITLGLGYAAREFWRGLGRLARQDGFEPWRWRATLGVAGLLLMGFVICGVTLGKAQAKGFHQSARQAFRSGTTSELLEIVEPLKGQVVMSNVYPSVVGFFSREATFGGCEIEAFSPEGRLNYIQNNDFERWDQSTQLPLQWHPKGADIWVERDPREPYRGTASARLMVGRDKKGQLDQRTVLPRQPEAYRLAVEIWVKANVPGRVRAFVGQNPQKFGTYHPGDGAWRLLVAETAMPASVIDAPRVRLGIEVEGGDATAVNVDAATVLTESLRVASADGRHATTGPLLQPSPMAPPHPAGSSGVDPSRCHTAWIRGYPRSISITPTHYVLFRSLFTGFTTCREEECLDQLEDYLRSRYPIVFQNKLGTVFRLDGSSDSTRGPMTTAREDR
jgi:hypothetical protein